MRGEMKIWAMAALALMLSAGVAEAAKWVQIGAVDYLDTDSIERHGDEVSYNIFTVTGDERPDDTTIGLRYTLNCKTRAEEPADFPSQSDILTKNEPIYRRLCMKQK
jgi:hypothetical protein